jgi:hypothetical protein
MTKEENRQIMETAKENWKRLNSCRLHDFSVEIEPQRKFFERYQCVNCGGHVDKTAKHWYEKALSLSVLKTYL